MPTDLTPEERSLRARVASLTRWAAEAPEAGTAQARRGQAGLLESFARKVDPDSLLNPAERYRRAEKLRQAHMARLALASAKARRKKAA